MIFTLLAWVYITIVCWAWGRLLTRAFKKIAGHTVELPFSITCLAGLSFIIIILGALSLFAPLGTWSIQFLFLLPSIFIIALEHKTKFNAGIRDAFSLHTPAIFLLLVSLLLILVMSTWKIIHPDTLGYHAQLIQWAEKYKALPGLVNLNTRYGLQSNWFLACALFDFKFISSQGLTYLNSTVLVWFILFVVKKINNYLPDAANHLISFLWILLLSFSFWSYTQVRLMATSASPDFFTTLLLWLILYLFLSPKDETEDSYSFKALLLALLCGTAITIKLSALPVLLIIIAVLVYLLRQRKIITALITASIIIIALLPFLARNVITSGYPLFPSTLGGFMTDWKLDEETTRQIAGYVTVYSRTSISYSDPGVNEILQMNLTEWIPAWWKVLSTADKSIMLMLLISIFGSIFFVKKIMRSDKSSLLALFTSFSGILFWFFLAPDPRFGFGFIFGFIGIVTTIILSGKAFILPAGIKKIFIVSIWAIGLFLSGYTVYRFKNFYTADQWLRPMGPEKVKYKTIICSEIKINVQLTHSGCGDAPVPCAYDSCGVYFLLRGDKVTDGFRSK